MATLTVQTIQTWQGTAVLVTCAFTTPTAASYPTISEVATDPSTVTLEWRWGNGNKTTWVYGLTGTTHVTKIKTGVYQATIPTSTAPSGSPTVPPTITGLWIGTGACKAKVPFEVKATATPL